MEPHLIDYYNETPHGINVVDKMNEELDELQKGPISRTSRGFFTNHKNCA